MGDERRLRQADPRPRFTLVVPTHNRRDLLRICLGAATAQDYPDYEVIVVDDGSTDGTGETVWREFPQVRYLRQERCRGPAAARNRGIEAATGEIVAFTDDDCLLPGDFLRQLAQGYGRHQVVGVGGYLEAPPELVRRNLLARYEALVTHRVYGAGREPYEGGFECPAGGTNSMSYRWEVLQAVGGFDETFPVPGGEDADLKQRVVAAGGRLLYLPVRVTHLQPYDLPGFWRQYRNHGRGAVHFERKHRGRPPGRGRVFVRAAGRLARWPADAVRLGPPLATVRLLAGLADVAGQWQEVGRLQGGGPAGTGGPCAS